MKRDFDHDFSSRVITMAGDALLAYARVGNANQRGSAMARLRVLIRRGEVDGLCPVTCEELGLI